MTLNHCTLAPVMTELMSSAQVSSRQKLVASFNRVLTFFIFIPSLSLSILFIFLSLSILLNDPEKRYINREASLQFPSLV